MGISASGITVRYGDETQGQTTALDSVDFCIKDEEFVSVIGPSGCGKSTLLYCLGGLLNPDAGSVEQDGAAVRGPAPDRAAFVFQDYGLLPWRRVIDNAALGLQFSGVSRRKRHEVGMRYLELMRLGDQADKYPNQLSGGMQQRVAVGRALALEPDVVLMDEPFGALDEMTRRALGIDVSKILTQQQKSVALVTHSLDEAIYWGDRVIVMSRSPGRIIKEFEVDQPRPRDIDFMASEGFAAARRELLDLLEEAEVEREAESRQARTG